MAEVTRSFSALSEEFVELSFRHDPVEATAVGIHDYDHVLPDDSPEGIQARVSWLRDFESRLRGGVDVRTLSPSARVDHTYLVSRVWTLRTELEELRVHARNPVRYPERALRSLFLLLARPFAPLEERKEALLERLMSVPDYLDSARRNLEPTHASTVQTALEVAGAGPAFVDEIARTLRRAFPGETERIEFAIQRARLGFLNYQAHLERQLLPAATSTFAIGKEALDARLRNQHFLDLDSDALREFGLRQVEAAHAALEAEAKRLDHGRTWQELIAAARANHPERGALREAYVRETQRALETVVEKRIAPVAGTALEVADTPVFYRPFQPYATYMPSAPFDPDQTGYFFVTPIDLGRPREAQEQQLGWHAWAHLPLVVLHEAYPGRHLQTGHANHAQSRLRQLAYNDFFAEGWALYCSELMFEHGYFTDPMTRLFQLRNLLWRACRVVIDVGLQCGHMTDEQAVEYLVTEALLERPSAQSEVRRYLFSPTQPMSYLVGMVEILKIRDEARARLGPRFDLHDFHAALLGVGALPPALVRLELEERLGVGQA